MDWYLGVLKKYAEFNGRARRKEYWFFALFNALIAFGLGILDGVLGLADAQSGYGPLGGLYGLAVLLPSIAVGVRRLHDTSRSGFWLFLVLIPLIGAIVLLVFFCQDSHEGQNEYGPSPKASPAPAM